MFARLFRDSRELWQRLPIAADRVCKISERVNAREAFNGQIGFHINSSAVTCRDTEITRQRTRL